MQWYTWEWLRPKGRLRLLQLCTVKNIIGLFVLKIWELNHYDCDGAAFWLVRHEVKLKLKKRSTEEWMFRVIDFDPHNGDVIVFLRDNDI